MRISTKGRYGLRVMLELACRESETPVLMGDLAEAQAVSRKYLHSLLTSLKAAGLVRAIRGAGGGYLLARAADTIQVKEVVCALEGDLTPVECVRNQAICDRVDQCVAREVWQELDAAIDKVLSGMTLQQLVERQKEKQAKRVMFHI